jgi:CBS domain-containing protein
MTHKVQDWMSKPVIVIDPDGSVSHALTLMRRRNIHSLVVNLEETPGIYGIVTITDIRDKIIAKQLNPSEITIRQIMTSPVVTARFDWSLVECSTEMQKNHVNHLPVVDENNLLVGIISTTDLFIAAEETGWNANS